MSAHDDELAREVGKATEWLNHGDSRAMTTLPWIAGAALYVGAVILLALAVGRRLARIRPEEPPAEEDPLEVAWRQVNEDERP